MSLPIVIIFERHWDKIPKILVRGLLPELVSQGYGTFCVEAPQNLAASELSERYERALSFDLDLQKRAETCLRRVGVVGRLSDMSLSSLSLLLKLHVSSKEYVELAEKIKALPAALIFREIFETSTRFSISVKGIDVDARDYDGLISGPLERRMIAIEEQAEVRNGTMFENLLRLKNQQGEGIVLLCGALHAEALINKFNAKKMQDEVLFYFPHSSQRYDDSIDDVNTVAMRAVLRGHEQLLEEGSVHVLQERIVQDVLGKIKYTREIVEENSHIEFLRKYFKVPFRAFLRPGYYVDALVEIADLKIIEMIKKCMGERNVATHEISLEARKYLVVSGVNTKEVAEKIHGMSR